MRVATTLLSGICALSIAVPVAVNGAVQTGSALSIDFDAPAEAIAAGDDREFVSGLEGRALRVRDHDSPLPVDAEGLEFNPGEDFSVQYWVRSAAPADRRYALLSHKQFDDNSLASQKSPGWVFYSSDGTWAWSMGSGDQRITYERDNGVHMPLNDGRWHQLAMTYDATAAEVRLYYDGRNRAIYSLADSGGFDFFSRQPLTIGGAEAALPSDGVVPAVRDGAVAIQRLVDAFNALGLEPLQGDELVNLMVEPGRLFEQRVEAEAAAMSSADAAAFVGRMEATDFSAVSEAESALMRNPYTIHQAFSFMEAAPAMKIYSLVDGGVVVDERVARMYSARERLDAPTFDVDNLSAWDRTLSAAEITEAYSRHFEPTTPAPANRVPSITSGVWNIFHGGKHFTVDEHGWDSRLAIAQILEREGVDVVMMQETYSSGDYIAAELGYYFATTVDRDYLNQGANISVLSRYPIEEVYVEGESTFMNVGARITLSESQDIYVMSNWYGMAQFPAVFGFHEQRFGESDAIPVLFGGDFNAVPHTDGNDSDHSRTMLDAGFTDAYRASFPDVAAFPGASHRSGRRIDQLYFKGAALEHLGTEVLTTWPTGFPSDHYLIKSVFNLR